VPGIGPLGASALVATIGDAKNFENGRQLAAWLGLVPRQHSSGGKPRLLGISKRGDAYVRTLLIHGARAVTSSVLKKADTRHWAFQVAYRRNKNVAARWHWPTRRPGSSGRFSLTSVSTGPTTHPMR